MIEGVSSGTLPLSGGHLVWSKQGSGPAIVLIHGFSLDRRMWHDVIPLLTTDFTVVSYDLRGFGESFPMDLHCGYTHHEDLVALLDHLGIARAVLVGFSFGGHVALTAAVQAPARVAALVLVDPLLEGVRWDAESTTAMHAVTTALHDHGVDAAKEAWLAHPFFTQANAQPEVAAALATMVHGYGGRHWLGEDPHATVEPAPIDVLRQLSVATTVVIGELDVAGFLDMSDRLARDTPGARLVRVPGCGHLTPMEAPRSVADAVRAAWRPSPEVIVLPDR